MHRFTSLFIAGVFAAALPASATQQPQPAAPRHDEHQTASAQAGVTPEQEKQMMAMHQKMMAEMKAMDAKVDALVARMKAAKGDAKIEATAEVVAALAEQRTSSRDRMTQMQSQMMGHMMQHMAGGATPQAMKGMMASCPMMKMMQGQEAGR